MCTKLPNNALEERLRWVLPIANKEIRIIDAVKVFPGGQIRIRAIKTDNGSCFTNRHIGYQKSADPANPRLHPLDVFLMSRNIIHYLIDPGKLAQNGHVERSHRTDQEMLYDRREIKTVLGLERAVKQWNIYYNNLEHIALDGLTPNEVLARVQNVCS